MSTRIRELRERNHLTQAELAKLLDVDESDVSRWEGGKRPLSPAVIERLAAIFKVASWELFLDRRALRRMGRENDHVTSEVREREGTPSRHEDIN